MSGCAAVLLAAGRSRRLGFDKILTPLAGRPVFIHSLDVLLRATAVARVVVVTREDIMQPIREMVRELPLQKPVDVVAGGVERQDSVAHGIRFLGGDADEILIHDAARPLLTVGIIEKTLEAARRHGAAVCASRATDTLKRAEPDGRVRETLDRSEIWLMQTPQIFKRDLIERAMRHVQEKGIAITDDASAVEALGEPVHLVESLEPNLKITRPMDWDLAGYLLQAEQRRDLRAAVHDLNNQLGPLVGYLPLLAKYGGSDPKFLGYLDKMRASTKDLQARLERLRSVARELCPDETSEEN